MNTTFDILVVILSVLLGLFLILAIASAVAVYKITKAVQRLVTKAEHMVDSAEEAATMFKNTVGPMSTVRALAHIIETVTGKHKGK